MYQSFVKYWLVETGNHELAVTKVLLETSFLWLNFKPHLISMQPKHPPSIVYPGGLMP
jgi:hypothetical protein